MDPRGRMRPTPPAALRVVFAGLVLYAAFGKGFAYLGVPPVFVGEVLLVVAVLGAAGSAMAVPRNPAVVVTGALAGMAVVQLAVDRHVAAVPLMETVRGLAPVTYAGFAFAVYALLRRLERRGGRALTLATVERALARVAPAVLAVVTGLAAFLIIEPTFVPSWPWSGAPVLLAKSTDLSVTLALLLPVLPGGVAVGRRRRLLLPAWGAAVLLVALRSRGAMLALGAGFLAVCPRAERFLKALFVAAAVTVALYVSGVSVTVGDRQASFDGLVDSVTSLLGAPDEGGTGSVRVATRNWRTDWWGAIWADVCEQRMLLHGRGWGDNLAVRHGLIPPSRADDPRALRAPHNIFFSLAGRAGLVTAVGFLLVPVATVVRSLRIRGDTGRSFAVGAVRGGLVAALVAGLSDVYLESPQGGILYWSLIGFLWWASAPPTGPAGEAALATDALRPTVVA